MIPVDVHHVLEFSKVALDPEISASDLLQQDLITEAAKLPVEVIGGKLIMLVTLW